MLEPEDVVTINDDYCTLEYLKWLCDYVGLEVVDFNHKDNLLYLSLKSN